MSDSPLRIGVIGLGRAFMLMLPTFRQDPRLRLVAAFDPRAEALEQFVTDFGGATYETAEALCANPDVEVVYVASPHQHHVEHVRAAARAGKHVLVEKPMALTLSECAEIVAAGRDHGIRILVGHSHSYDAPYLRTREMIDTGRFGTVRMITALNFTDYLYRPRRPEELDSAQGGGAVFSQAPHHADIVRLLGGGRVRTVRAATGNWDPRRPTEGAYSAFLTFAEGASATMTYSGYGHFDSDELLGWVGEMGHARSPEEYGAGRRMLATVATPAEEAALKNTRAYGVARSGGPGAKPAANPVGYNHFGMFVVSCEHADLRPMPDGVMVYADERRWLEPLPAVTVPRAEVVDELLAVVREGQAPLHSAEWGMATVEVCLAILESARTGSEVPLRHQVGVSGARARAQPD